MTESPREVFLVAVQGVLRGMTGPRYWGGNYPNAPMVERIFKEPLQVNQFPHLCLLQETGSHVVAATQERYEDLFRVVIYGYVDGDDRVTPSTWAERLNRDCKISILAAFKTGQPLADLAAIYADDFGEEDIQFGENRAAFILPFTAHIEDALTA